MLPAQIPAQPSERRAWVLACSLLAIGVSVLAAVLGGAIGSSQAQAPQPVLVSARTPLPAAEGDAPASIGSVVSRPSAAEQSADAVRFRAATKVHIGRRWMEGFYPIYETAQSAFGVDWLLIASIHMQESAFSTAPGTYSGLNFAHCCGGPMQFNVTNGHHGAASTWALFMGSYRYARRPARYDHMTAVHPSIYDDFDAIMAAAHLLSADGAGYALDGSAWDAAYDYYGHDATGVLYADQVLARAIGWSQHGFCINCGVDPALVQAADAAYGAPVRAALEGEALVAAQQRHGRPARRRLAHARKRRPAAAHN